jgi:ADP-ribose diphosphatase
MPTSPPTSADVEIVARRAAYRGYLRIDAYTLRHRLHRGGWSQNIDREVLERGHVAAVLPYDPARDSVVLIEQFRIGAFAAGLGPWLSEAVAGVIEPGESPETVARREALEEAGTAILALEPIARYLSSPGGSSETVHVFCGRIDAHGAGGIFGLASEHEDIKAAVLPWRDVRRGLGRGLFKDSLTLIAVQWLALNRRALRAKWQP